MKKRQITLTSKDIVNILTLMFACENDFRNKKPFIKWMRRFENELTLLLNDMEGLF